MKQVTEGGHLEFVVEFRVNRGGRILPHSYHAHEFYYVTGGRGIMTIDGESREISPGDLVHIPPDAIQSMEPVGEQEFRGLIFAIGLRDTPEVQH